MRTGSSKTVPLPKIRFSKDENHRQSKRRYFDRKRNYQNFPNNYGFPKDISYLPSKNSNSYRRAHPGILQPLSPKALYPCQPPATRWVPKCFGIPSFVERSVMNTNGSGNTISSSNNGSNSSSSGNSGNGIGGGGLGMDSGLFGGGGGNVGKAPGNGNKNGGGRPSEMDLDGFEYPDSPTSQKWLENPDLIPLTVLDNINLKTEFPYATNTTDIDKPPDINSISIDHLANADNLFQFTASIPPPVPDATSTNFLDLPGNETDSFSQSLYDDLVDINLAEFSNVSTIPSNTISLNSATSTSSASMCSTMPSTTGNLNIAIPQSTTILSTMIPTSLGVASAPSKITLPAKPLSFDSLEQNINTSNLISSLSRLKAELPPISVSVAPQLPTKPAIDIGSLNLSLLPLTAQAAVAALAQASNAPPAPASVISTSNMQSTPLPSVIKNLIEPLPAASLKDFIKIEPETLDDTNHISIPVPSSISTITSPSPPQIFAPTQCFNIKIENNNNSLTSTSFPVSMESTPTTLFAPISLPGATCNVVGNGGQILPNGNSPPSVLDQSFSDDIGGGKIKSSLTRKKSTCSITSNSSSGTSSGNGTSTYITTIPIPAVISNTPSSNDEEDISNIPSLQMRIQIISQRVSYTNAFIGFGTNLYRYPIIDYENTYN